MQAKPIEHPDALAVSAYSDRDGRVPLIVTVRPFDDPTWPIPRTKTHAGRTYRFTIQNEGPDSEKQPMRARTLIVMFALGSVLLAGCLNSPRRNPPRTYQQGMAIPPANIPIGPPMAPVPGKQPPPGDAGETWLPQDPPPGKSKSEYPKRVPSGKPGVELGEPDYVERPKDLEAPKADPVEPKMAEPIEHAKGITDFTQVKDNVSAGQRPEIEGLDWLKANGYKTIVYVRRAGDDDTTDRRQVEKREMQYVGLVVAPGTLTQEWMEEFNRVVGDSKSRPMFVYGDPATVGAVWYLHLRMAEFLTHDEARIRAGRLGLTDEKSEMFQAALKVLPRN